VNGPLETEGGSLARADADRELTFAGGGQLMDDAMTEAVAGTDWQRLGVEIGLDVGWRHTGAIVFDGELQTTGNDGKGDTDLPGRGKGNRRAAGLLVPNGLGCIANEIDGDALDDFRRKTEWRKRILASDGDVRCAGGDAPEHRRKGEQHGGVVGGVGKDVGGARTAAAKALGWTNRCGVGAERKDAMDAGDGCYE
jgi:hypothetical protein